MVGRFDAIWSHRMSDGEDQILLTLIGKLERIEGKIDALRTDLAQYGEGLSLLADAVRMQTTRISEFSVRMDEARDEEVVAAHALRG